ncbi:DUF4252 domain-containing protein [Croceivirga thetidis]|uniref:DUF4252 domain-containing protein n=1 Tax=Croceivirga thetidis TaxID=2721623 RepID=A0ABX1GSM6_9FLAO|nr:DUF4252 domain-containing protein [Croceivirga thetidis]NKI32624.1 DUF4252 domain-containing protein [Croceivirga thetidis]
MKKSIVVFALAIMPLFGFSQSVFDKFEDYDEVTSVVVSKKAFELLAKFDIDVDDPDGQDFMDIATSLSGMKVFTTEDKGISAEMKAAVDKYLGSSQLSELMRVKDKDANVKFYIREGKDDDHVRELLMFMTGVQNVEMNDRKIETVLLTLTGDIDLNKINSLTKKMNLPDELNKAGKKGK